MQRINDKEVYKLLKKDIQIRLNNKEEVKEFLKAMYEIVAENGGTTFGSADGNSYGRKFIEDISDREYPTYIYRTDRALFQTARGNDHNFTLPEIKSKFAVAKPLGGLYD